MIYPSAELVRDVNGNLTMRQMNGILLLSASHLRGSEVLERKECNDDDAHHPCRFCGKQW